MGKVKRLRQKYHASAKHKDDKAKDDLELPPLQEENNDNNFVIDANLFSGINIDTTALKDRLPDFDARSAITSKTLKGLRMKKKDKLKLRREYFMQKIDAIQTAKKKEKERKKRAKTAVVGDMSVIEEALPTLDLLMKTSSKDKVPNVRKKRCVEKAKKRMKKRSSNVKAFRQVLQHPSFRSNPLATINEHLNNKMKQEENGDEET